MKGKNEAHLNYRDKTNRGSFYTPAKIVDLVYELIEKNSVPKVDVVLEPSCGYGAFFYTNYGDKSTRFVGADIDPDAVKIAQSDIPNAEFSVQNALDEIHREKYGISESDSVLIVGNPLYNDKTSHVKASVKTETTYSVDERIQSRDVGLSSLLAYNILKPDYIAVLHPLSFLIKIGNYKVLRPFLDNYELMDGVVFSSAEFPETSRVSQFPIIAALYKKSSTGTSFEDMSNQAFKTLEGGIFRINDFEYIDSFVSKYPSKHKQKDFTGYMFYTLRDINALKRSRTFIKEDIPNAIHIKEHELPYFYYIDVFKNYFVDQIPYYMGNMNIPIDNAAFRERADDFELISRERHSDIFGYLPGLNTEKSKLAMMRITHYFDKLLKVAK